MKNNFRTCCCKFEKGSISLRQQYNYLYFLFALTSFCRRFANHISTLLGSTPHFEANSSFSSLLGCLFLKNIFSNILLLSSVNTLRCAGTMFIRNLFHQSYYILSLLRLSMYGSFVLLRGRLLSFCSYSISMSLSGPSSSLESITTIRSNNN